MCKHIKTWFTFITLYSACYHTTGLNFRPVFVTIVHPYLTNLTNKSIKSILIASTRWNAYEAKVIIFQVQTLGLLGWLTNSLKDSVPYTATQSHPFAIILYTAHCIGFVYLRLTTDTGCSCNRPCTRDKNSSRYKKLSSSKLTSRSTTMNFGKQQKTRSSS